MMPTLAAMLLAIDVGNTNIVVGVFDGDQLIADFRIHTDDRFTGDELGLVLVDLLRRRDLAPGQVSAVVVSSVVPTPVRRRAGTTASMHSAIVRFSLTGSDST